MGAVTNVLSGVGERARVDAVSLDDFLEARGSWSKGRLPDLVKVDVEGAEAEVIRGARGLLSARRTTWIVEIHEGSSLDDLQGIFQNESYRMRRLEPRSGSNQTVHVIAEPILS